MTGSTGPLTSGSLHTGVPRGASVTSDQSGPAGKLRGFSSGPALGQRFIPTSGNSDTPPFRRTPLADRTIESRSSMSSFMTEPTDLPPALDSGEIDVEGGGKIIFSRTNGDNLMTAQDELLSKIHEKEESGELNKGSTKKLKKFFGGLIKVFVAVISSKKFQTCVGLIGIGVFIAAGCVNPILFMGTVPFLVIFVNGIIEEPKQALPPVNGNNNQPTAGTDSSKKTSNTIGTNTESTEMPPATNPDNFPPPPPPPPDDDDLPWFPHGAGGAYGDDRSRFPHREGSAYGDDRFRFPHGAGSAYGDDRSRYPHGAGSAYGDDFLQFPHRRVDGEDADRPFVFSYRTDDNSLVFPHRVGGEDADDFSTFPPFVDGDNEPEGGPGGMVRRDAFLRGQRMQAELTEAKKLAYGMRMGMADEGVEGSTAVISRPLADGILREINISDFASSAPEKPVVIERYVKDELLGQHPDLEAQLLQSFRAQGKEGTDDRIIGGLIKDLEARVKFMAPLYNKGFPDLARVETLSHHRDLLKQKRFAVPAPGDWIKIQNLLTKDIVRRLIEDAAVKGSVLHFKSESSFKTSSDRREMMVDALKGIGLPYKKENTEKPINKLGVSYCSKALNYWTEGLMGSLFPKRSD